MLEGYLIAVPALTISETEEVRRELIQTEQKYQSEITDVRSLVANLQNQVSFLSSSILSAKIQALPALSQNQDRK
jgi:uncharacterized membrane protein